MAEFPNVTGNEVLAIMDSPSFQRPEDIPESDWEKALGEVRSAIRALGDNFDFPIGHTARGSLLWHEVCAPINRLAAKSEKIDQGLLVDKTVQRVRKEIGMRLMIRTRLPNFKDWEEFLETVRREDGKITTKIRQMKKFSNLLNAINRLVNEFGDTKARKEFGYTLIAEFMTKETGMAVTFERVKMQIMKRPPKIHDVKKNYEDDYGTEALIEGFAEELADFIRSTETFITKLTEKREALQTALEGLDWYIKTARQDVDNAKVSLGPAEIDKNNVEETYRSLLRVRKLASRDQTSEPKLSTREQQEKDRALRAIDNKYAEALSNVEKLQARLASLQRQAEKLSAQKKELPAQILRLRTLLETLRAFDIQAGPTASSPEPPAHASRTAAAPPSAAAHPPTTDRSNGEIAPGTRITNMAALYQLDGKTVTIKATTENKAILAVLLVRTVRLDEQISATVERSGAKVFLAFVETQGKPGARKWSITDLDGIKKACMFTV